MKKSRKAAPKARQSTVRTKTVASPKGKARCTAIASKVASFAPQQTPARTPTKAAQVLKVLQQPNGATISELMKATGWQAHSVRGFLSGTVRKRLDLSLLTEDTAAGRRYRLAAVRSAT